MKCFAAELRGIRPSEIKKEFLPQIDSYNSRGTALFTDKWMHPDKQKWAFGKILDNLSCREPYERNLSEVDKKAINALLTQYGKYDRAVTSRSKGAATASS